MAEKDHGDSCSEPVVAPLLRLEVTMHTAPAFRYLDEMPLGESEPCETGSVSFVDPLEYLEVILRRPGMFAPGVASLRDMFVFVEGWCRGMAPPCGHSFDGAYEFGQYVNQRFGQPSIASWRATLERAFSDRQFYDACEAIADVIQDWRRSQKGSEPPDQAKG